MVQNWRHLRRHSIDWATLSPESMGNCNAAWMSGRYTKDSSLMRHVLQQAQKYSTVGNARSRSIINGKRLRITCLVTVLLSLAGASCAAQVPTDKSYSAPPPMIIDSSKHYTATIETEKGNLTLELFASDAPATVNNFVFLAREGFYDNTIFHRVVPDFVVQGGDPTGTGSGTPGYYIDDEFSEHTHVAGALSMANSGPNRNGCQFFITYEAEHHLDGKHSVFGQLVDGMNVLQRIEQGDVITRVTIAES